MITQCNKTKETESGNVNTHTHTNICMKKHTHIRAYTIHSFAPARLQSAEGIRAQAELWTMAPGKACTVLTKGNVVRHACDGESERESERELERS
jgi:hypothetical protein